MAEYQQIMQALRAADAAGNAEDARKLAQMAQRARKREVMAPPAQEALSPSLGSGIAKEDDAQFAAESPNLYAAREALKETGKTVAGAAREAGEFLGLDTALDPITRTAARMSVSEKEREAIPEATTAEIVGGGLMVGSMFLPYRMMQSAITKGFGPYSASRMAKIIAAAGSGAAGGYAYEGGEALAKGEDLPSPGAATAMGAGIPMAVAAAPSVIKAAGEGVSNFLGMTTGVGGTGVKKAFTSGKGFREGVTGKIVSDDVLDSAVSNLYELKAARGASYRSRLDKIAKMRSVVIDRKKVGAKLRSAIRSFGVNVSPGTDRTLNIDMSHSKIDRGARSAVKEMIEDIVFWDDWTPLGADTLKQRIDDFYAPTKNSRAMVSALRNEVKKAIVKQVPQYQKMVREYEVMTNHIEDINNNLLQGKTDTALRKLNTIFRDVNEYRLGVLEKLDDMTGANLADQLAGIAMRPTLPRGQLTKMATAAETGWLMSWNPLAAVSLMAASSPRIVGETAHALGRATRTGKKLVKPVGKTRAPGDILMEKISEAIKKWTSKPVVTAPAIR